MLFPCGMARSSAVARSRSLKHVQRHKALDHSKTLLQEFLEECFVLGYDDTMSLERLVDTVWNYYIKEGRSHLLWRRMHDPYRILVSEFMLQQTQVSRVEEKYRQFLKRFPTVHTLASASFAEVLGMWQGLGYNRRAKFLHQTAKLVVKAYNGTIPNDPETIETFPGIGPYIARAIAIFAFNRPEVCIETNIRTVFTHFCFPRATNISDIMLLPRIEKALQIAQEKGYPPRAWYGALMDYGVYLKGNGVRINHKSAHYNKQSAFKGSGRELRGAILRELLRAPATTPSLAKILMRTTSEVQAQLVALQREGMVESRGRRFLVVSA